MQKRLFEQALHIEAPYYIKELNFDIEARRLDIHIDFKKGSTFINESKEYKAYDTKEKKWRHLNFFEYECYLHARVPRIRLEDGGIKLIRMPWEGLSLGFTLLFEALLMQLCKAMPVNQVSQLVRTSDDKLWRMLDRYVEKARENEDFSQLTAVGVDETSKKKHHDYISLFVDMEKRKTIFITEGKSSQTVKDFKEDLKQHGGKVENIKDISCDMSPAFIKGVKENLPNAEITFDKFHILKIINTAVDIVRKTEAGEYDILKSTKYIFLKNRQNLTKKQSQKLTELSISKLNLKTIRSLHIRENFQQIYDAATKSDFEKLLKKWYFWAIHSRIEPIKQAAKAKARGYRTSGNFKIIAYLITAELNFYQLNPNII